jgi:ABC-type multidrug transport system ATPase subunit
MENLLVFGYLYGVKNPKKQILEYLQYFEIEDLVDQQYMDLSSGQKTRVNLIKSLVNNPEIILMDEPTASLDPDITDKTLTLIEKLKKERNLTLLYTSHNMDEITRICDDVIFLDHGSIVAHDTPLGLTKRIKSASLRLIVDDKKDTLHAYLSRTHQQFSIADRNTVVIKTEESLIPKLIFDISNTGVWITDIEVLKPTLEDVFLQIARGGDAA